MSALTTLKNVHTLNGVAQLVGYKPKKLSFLLYKFAPQLRYKTFTIPKRSGGLRTISVPIPQFMLVQRRLSIVLRDCWEEIEAAKGPSRRALSHGFRPGRSIISNASVHRGRRWVFNVDLKDFFPSINFGRVRGFFAKNEAFMLPDKVATVIAQIACSAEGLPQGAPTSPVISNLIAHVLDVRLAQIARKHGCSYSRYADDLTFSTNLGEFPAAIAKAAGDHEWTVGKTLAKAIEDSGFVLNPSKTRMQYRDSRQVVTGLVVNRRINTRSEYRRTLRAMTHRLITTGKFYRMEMKADAQGTAKLTKVESDNVHHLQGMFGFVDFVDTHVRAAAGLDEHAYIVDDKGHRPRLSSMEKTHRRFLMHVDFWSAALPTILCEGKTDNIYIRGAIRRLAAAHPKLAKVPTDKKAKTDYLVRLYGYSRITRRVLGLSGGCSHLNTFLMRHYLPSVSELEPPKKQSPLIVLLDNDEGGKKSFFGLIKGFSKAKNVDGMEPFYHLKHNVYVVFTPIAKPGDQSKIEDFFDPQLLAVKINGKSFNPENDGLDTEAEYGKWVFATQVIRPNIEKIDFSKFDSILKRFEAVMDDFSKKKSQKE